MLSRRVSFGRVYVTNIVLTSVEPFVYNGFKALAPRRDTDRRHKGLHAEALLEAFVSWGGFAPVQDASQSQSQMELVREKLAVMKGTTVSDLTKMLDNAAPVDILGPDEAITQDGNSPGAAEEAYEEPLSFGERSAAALDVVDEGSTSEAPSSPIYTYVTPEEESQAKDAAQPKVTKKKQLLLALAREASRTPSSASQAEKKDIEEGKSTAQNEERERQEQEDEDKKGIRDRLWKVFGGKWL